MSDDENERSLRDVILAQSAEGVAVPVLLHDSGADVRATPQAYLDQSAAGRESLAGGRTDLVRDGVLAANIHRVPPENRAEAASRLRRLAELGPAWQLPVGSAVDRRSVFVGFYDGYRDTAFWGAELCAELGLRAWFFPIFEGTVAGQAELDDHDLARLAEHHELGFHSFSHRSAAEIDETNLQREVLDPIARITASAGRPPLLGAWRGGARFDHDHLADRALRDAGIRALVSNWSIEEITR